MDKVSLHKERSQLVVKSNALIQKTRYSLSSQEQKILLYVISKIKKEDDDFKIYTVDIKDLCEVCGIELNGKNYQNFKNSIQSLHNKSFWIKTPKKECLMSWVERVEINQLDTTVSFRIDDRLKPYLLELKSGFTQYELISILSFKSKYSIRFYELLKSYLYYKELNIRIEELRDIFDIKDKYKEYKELKRNVIQVAINEINTYTELFIEYKPIRINRKIESLLFTIKEKENIEDNLKSIRKTNEALNKVEAKG